MWYLLIIFIIISCWVLPIHMEDIGNVFVHDDHGDHRQKCKVVKDHNYNAKDNGISIFTSPISILPADFKFGVTPESSTSINVQMTDDAANWVVMSWLLNQQKDSSKHRHCVDIGSYFGANMLHMASLGCYTHSFEKNRTLALLLNYNSHLNRLNSKIRVHNLVPLLDRIEFHNANSSDSNSIIAVPQLPIIHDCIPRHHNISLIRIDLNGEETEILRGLQSTMQHEYNEAFQIAIRPSKWGNNLKNSSSLFSILKFQNYSLQIIIGNSKNCPRSLLPDNKVTDVSLTGDAVLKVIPWDYLINLLTPIATGNYYCYLWITRHPIRDQLQIFPLHHGLFKFLEGKPVRGFGSEIFYASDGKKRSIPNMDTFASMKFKQEDVIQLGTVINTIPTGDSIPPV